MIHPLSNSGRILARPGPSARKTGGGDVPLHPGRGRLELEGRCVADRFIAVAGNIGVGKTTLVEYLTRRYGIQPVYEPFDKNPYLDDFYADMRSWAFHSQTWFLTHKFQLHQDVDNTPGTLVQDRTIYEDAEIFATYMHHSRRMTKRDYETYWALYQSMCTALGPPDLLIYLKCSVRAIRKRVKLRGRASEQDLPASYLRNLNKLYASWIARYDMSPVIEWDTEKLDYVGDLVHRLEFHRTIEKYL